MRVEGVGCVQGPVEAVNGAVEVAVCCGRWQNVAKCSKWRWWRWQWMWWRCLEVRKM